MRALAALAACAVALATAGATSAAPKRSWAQPQIERVVAAVADAPPTIDAAPYVRYLKDKLGALTAA